MTQGKFDKIFIGQPDCFVQLQLKHVVLLDFYRIFDGHNLLSLKKGLGQFVHQGCLATSDWTSKEIETTLPILLAQFFNILKPKMQILLLIVQQTNNQTLMPPIISHGRQTQRRHLLPMLIVARAQLTTSLLSYVHTRYKLKMTNHSS